MELPSAPSELPNAKGSSTATLNAETPVAGNGRRNGAKGHRGGRNGGPKVLRAPVFALRNCRSAAAGAAAVAEIKTGLQTSKAGYNVPMDGPLLGMAAAQAGRLGMRDLIEILCSYARDRLEQCGGREVAELTSAAARLGYHDKLFLSAAAVYCYQHSASFSSLRDVSLMSVALLKHCIGQGHEWSYPDSRALPFDCALAFHGLSFALSQSLQKVEASPRDLAEFAYALSQVCQLRPFQAGQALYETPIVVEAFKGALTYACQSIHMASPQDVAKLLGAISLSWSVLEHLQKDVLRPCLEDLEQAVRFDGESFNSQDIALTCVAFSKICAIDDVVADVLADQVAAHVSKFTSKDMCLVLWSAANSAWATERWGTICLQEIPRRNLAHFSVKDLCMASQALAKLGPCTQTTLCLLAGEAYKRSLRHFGVTDKLYFLWALAKLKVVHLELCHMLVKQLLEDGCNKAPRSAISAALWSLAVLWPSLRDSDETLPKLCVLLCQSAPWEGGAHYEVANAAWAFGQLRSLVPSACWTLLCHTVSAIVLSHLSLHELCNFLQGFAVCPKEATMGTTLFARFASEVTSRLRSSKSKGQEGLDTLSAHDLRLLSGLLSYVKQSPIQEIQELAEVLQVEVSPIHQSSPPSGQTGHGDERENESHGHGHFGHVTSESGHGHGHGHGHEVGYLGNSNQHQNCCPQIQNVQGLYMMRLNTHCSFPGHCVQLDGSFIHLECAHVPITNNLWPVDHNDCEVCNELGGQVPLSLTDCIREPGQGHQHDSGHGHGSAHGQPHETGHGSTHETGHGHGSYQ